jgi:outer membrane protein TolC
MTALSIMAPCAAAQARLPLSRADRTATDTLTLSFGLAVTRALRDGEEVRSARASVDVADAQVGIARSTGLPQLRLNSGYNQQVENARAALPRWSRGGRRQGRQRGARRGPREHR